MWKTRFEKSARFLNAVNYWVKIITPQGEAERMWIDHIRKVW